MRAAHGSIGGEFAAYDYGGAPRVGGAYQEEGDGLVQQRDELEAEGYARVQAAAQRAVVQAGEAARMEAERIAEARGVQEEYREREILRRVELQRIIRQRELTAQREAERAAEARRQRQGSVCVVM